MNYQGSFRSCVAAVAACVALSAGVVQADPVKLRMGSATADADTDVFKIAYLELQEALDELAPGEFEISFFPNRQLGDEKEMVQGLQLGVLDLATITNSVVANVAPQFVVNDLPFLYSSQEVAASVLDSELGDELLASLEKDRIVGLAFCEAGYRHMLNNVRPVNAPADVVDAKYRVMQSPIFIGMFESLDGNPVPMAWGDTITAFQQGAIDGLEVPAWVVAGAKLDEVAKYMSLTRHVYSAAPMMMSKASFDKLSEEQQALLRKAAKQACGEQRTLGAAQEAEIIQNLRNGGKIEINDVTESAPFRDAMQPVYEQYRDKIGSDRLDAWLEAVKD